MTTQALAPLPTLLATALAVALVPSRAAALAVAIAALPLPLLEPVIPLRGILGLGQVMILMRAIDLCRQRADWGFARRLWHVTSAADSRLLARTKFAGHPGNPLDAHASDPRIQVWPCRSGGICNWKR